MKKTTKALLFIAASALFWGSIANAKSVRVRVLDSDLAKLPFGGTTADAFSWVDNKIAAFFDPRIKAALDRSERSAATKAMETKKAEVRSSLLEFKGQKTGLENSVVSGEFVHGAEESLVRYQEGDVDHYLLFTGGKLWKYIRALKAEGKFAARVKEHSRDFGVPSNVKSGKQGITQATWEGDKLVLTIRDLRSVYGTDLLIVVNKRNWKAADQRRKAMTKDKGPDIDPELQGILED